MEHQIKIKALITPTFIIMVMIMMITSFHAQLSVTANIQASIIGPDDICSMDLSSQDGTRFLLKNGANSCFDISINGLQPSLEGENGIQKVSYSLSFNRQQAASIDMTSISLNVAFNEAVKSGLFVASSPYQIFVNYN